VAAQEPPSTPEAPPAATAPDTPAEPAAAAAAPKAQAHSQFHGSFELDNQYSIGTEPLRATLALGYSNLFSKQDELSALYQLAPQDARQVGVFVTSYAAHPLPDGLQPSVYFVDSNTNVPNAETAGVIGKGQILGLRVSHPLSAGTGATQSLTLAAEYKHFRNTLALVDNVAASTPISYLNLSLAYAGNWSSAHREAGLSVSANFGPRGGANAANAYLENDFHAAANYLYLRADGAVVTALPAGLRLYLRVAGQYADKSLNINEDYPVAGIDGVRGYLEAEVLGDRALKGTVQLQSPVWQRGAKSLADGFLYFDAAVAQMLEVLPGEPMRMHPRSWGFGVDLWPGRKLTGSLVWAHPLVSASATRADESRLLFLLRGTF
jgi:hemolysin activation/secretion protein